MACPFFNPTEPISWHNWPDPPRLPLGDPYAGNCAAVHDEPSAERLRTCCNTGYARGACPSFPGGDAPDAVRFGIVERGGGLATIRYVLERNHHPYEHGDVRLAEHQAAISGTLLDRQADAFLRSYLRRTGSEPAPGPLESLVERKPGRKKAW